MSTKKKIILGVVVVAILGVLGAYGYILFIKPDADPALDNSDLDAALDATTTIAVDATEPAATEVPGDSTATADTTAPDTAAPVATEAAGNGVDGVWNISTDSILGYRVSEVLGGVDTEANGRTNSVTGSLTLEGTTATAAEFTVDMTTFASDSDRRDGQFNGRIMTVDQFPTSTFVLTSPIDFGAVPAEGESITATATGDLTLRGVTNSVTFELTAKLENGRIGVLGNIPILFSDYQIPDPSNGFAEVKDNGLLEFVLVFDRA
jgi:polyisoprenoid-binding protein YceI